MITVVGLGTRIEEVTALVMSEIKSAGKVYISGKASAAAGILRAAGVRFEYLPLLAEVDYFESARQNATNIMAQADGRKVCYCAYGSVNEDGTCRELIANGAKIINGVSAAESAAVSAGILKGFASVNAYAADKSRLSLPLVVYGVDDAVVAARVKNRLIKEFGNVSATYIHGGRVNSIRLEDADGMAEYDQTSAIAVRDIPLIEKLRFDLDDLMDVLCLLRAPDGCPWDRAQTHESIRLNAVEEAYELVDAIDKGCSDGMMEEAGDVIMQAAFHTLIEKERGNFDMRDVISALCTKLITRHTHVFGKDSATEEDGALSVWDKNKMKEKHQSTYSQSVNDVPQSLPALLRAQKVFKRMQKGGWKEDLTPSEWFKRVENGDTSVIGKALWQAAAICRSAGEESEQSLMDEVKRMQREYTEFERLVINDGKDVTALTQEQTERYKLLAHRVCAGKSNCEKE